MSSELELFVGSPAGFRDTPGTSALEGFGQFEDRILYAVVEVFNTDSSYREVARLGGGVNDGRIQLRANSSGALTLGARFDTPNGASNSTLSASGTRTPGIHIIWAQTDDSMTTREMGGDSPERSASGPLVTGDGMLESPPLYMSGAGASETPLAVMAFRGSHDETQRAHVIRWLAEQFGAPFNGNDDWWPWYTRANGSITLARINDGDKGDPGPQGTSVTSITRFYRTGTTAPAKPTVNPAPSPWTTTEPAYVAGQSLYYTDMTLLSTGAFIYSNVQKSSSYEVAVEALTTASGKNKIFDSTANATGSTQTAGDQWRKWDKLTTGRKLLASWTWNGTAWIADALSETYLPLVNIGSGTYGDLHGQRLESDTVEAIAIKMGQGFANKFWANEANIGQIKTNHLSPLVGDEIWIGDNLVVKGLHDDVGQLGDDLGQLDETVTDIGSQIESVGDMAGQAIADAAIADGKALAAEIAAQNAQAGVTLQQSIFKITPTGGQVVSKDGQNSVDITATGIVIRTGSAVAAELSGARLVVNETIVNKARLANHVIEKHGSIGTTVRPI